MEAGNDPLSDTIPILSDPGTNLSPAGLPLVGRFLSHAALGIFCPSVMAHHSIGDTNYRQIHTRAALPDSLPASRFKLPSPQ